MERPIEAVLCDLGHTLVPWSVERAVLPTVYQPVHRFLLDQGIHPGPLAEEFVLRLVDDVSDRVGASYERGELAELDLLSVYADALRHLGLKVSREQVERIVELEHRSFISQLRVPPETLATLRTLRERGYRLGIVSNTANPERLMRADLELLGLEPLVDAAVFSSGVGVRKPDARIYQAVLDQLGRVPPARCLFVGDRVREDIRGPQALGMRAVLTHEHRQEEPGDARPDAVIGRFAELLDLLDGRAG